MTVRPPPLLLPLPALAPPPVLALLRLSPLSLLFSPLLSLSLPLPLPLSLPLKSS